MPVVLEEAADLPGISGMELERQSLRAFLEKELRAVQVEILAICQRYGVSSWYGMNDLIVEGTVDEGKILDDFQRVDHLTAKAKRIQELVGRVRWSECTYGKGSLETIGNSDTADAHDGVYGLAEPADGADVSRLSGAASVEH